VGDLTNAELSEEIDYRGSPIETQPHTGLRCLECKRPVGVLDEVTSDAVTMHCPACGYRWSMVRPGK